MKYVGLRVGAFVGEEVGVAVAIQVFPSHVDVTQSSSVVQIFPTSHLGHPPPPPQSISVSNPFLIPSAQLEAVGFKVGVVVGVDVGATLGKCVGDVVGSKVGDEVVGEFVGCSDGAGVPQWSYISGEAHTACSVPG